MGWKEVESAEAKEAQSEPPAWSAKEFQLASNQRERNIHQQGDQPNMATSTIFIFMLP